MILQALMARHKFIFCIICELHGTDDFRCFFHSFVYRAVLFGLLLPKTREKKSLDCYLILNLRMGGADIPSKHSQGYY